MFKRLMLDDTTAIVTVVAFLTAATIYAGAVWRAFRMKRPQVERLASIPLADDERPAGAASAPVNAAPSRQS